LQPRAILVMGTRIIGAEVLRSVDAPFINYHAGVTPKYRGVHGGYWAKAQGDDDNFGVTIHLVDEGIDTGSVLHQARPATSAKDNYSSYPYLQLAAALPLLERSAREAIAGTLSPQRVDLPSGCGRTRRYGPISRPGCGGGYGRLRRVENETIAREGYPATIGLD
jgi:methionyl-tRNA formyltransferase